MFLSSFVFVDEWLAQETLYPFETLEVTDAPAKEASENSRSSALSSAALTEKLLLVLLLLRADVAAATFGVLGGFLVVLFEALGELKSSGDVFLLLDRVSTIVSDQVVGH